MPSERQLRKQIVHIARLLHEHGLTAGTEGNISVRLNNQRVLATPTSTSKGMLKPNDLVLVDMNGHRLTKQPSHRNVSSEIAMHLLFYKLRPDVGAVVHAHPPTATGFAAAGIALDQPLVPEIIVLLKKIPLARYRTPGTPQLSDALSPVIADHDAILMANHGVVTCGTDLLQAYLKMETVEQFAKIALVARQLGGAQELKSEEVTKLLQMREQYLRNARAPGRRH